MLAAAAAIHDTDGNGTLELMLSGGSPVSGETAWGWGPRRNETHTWAWNGTWFVLSSIERDPPKFRFQAVQDGDRAFLTGHLVDALSRYRRAIDDVTLDWWSPARLAYEIARVDGIATDPPPPEPDPAERPRLAAYALYRITLLAAVQGDTVSAAEAYQGLQDQYAGTEAGGPYASLAARWWEKYVTSRSVALACVEAIEYAAQQAASIIEPLESSYYGPANIGYTPRDVCPVTP